jgi:hypothetical protein
MWNPSFEERKFFPAFDGRLAVGRIDEPFGDQSACVTFHFIDRRVPVRSL